MLKIKYLLRFLFLFTFLLLHNKSVAQENTKKVCDDLIEKGKAALRNNQYSHSLQLLTNALSIAQKNDWKKQEFTALNNIGANYYMLLEYGEALSNYLDAYKIAMNTLGYKEEMAVLNNIAILYFEEEDFDNADEYFKKAYKIAKEQKEWEKAGLYAVNLGNSANGTGKYSLGRKYFNEAIPLLTEKKEFLSLAKVGLCVSDLHEGKPQQAIKSAEQLLTTTESLDFNETGILLYTVISKAYLKENRLEKALEFVNKIFAGNPSHKMKVEAFSVLSEINFRSKKYDAALQYKDSIIAANKELEKIKNNQLYENSKVKLGIENYKNELVVNEARLSSERRLFYSIIAVILIVVACIVWSLRSLSVKHKQNKIIAERDKQILELELTKKQNESLLLEKQFTENQTSLLLEQERLKNEIEVRNRKLSAKALYLSGRNQMLEDIVSELSRLAQISESKALLNHMETLKNHLDLNNDWKDFVTHFEEVNQGFLKALKERHPNLSANDIRYVSYVYMNLSSKEIATMFNISQDSSRKRKERIITKMELSNSVNLYNYLALLS
ncbi:tetratricopeptide repeat protein [Flavobacterium enshiense]|uniref:tetratricopeptide repeat protein n=1 Tax=Flavobacterium enshiense TaxID=1341165 RepID=UPI00345D39B5